MNPPPPWDLAGRLNELAKAFLALRQRVDAIEAAQQPTALAALAQSVQDLETKLAAWLPLVDPDRLEVAGVCQRLGVRHEWLRSRDPRPERVQAVRRVFAELERQGWSADRIARAAHYTARGVQSNLAKRSS